MNAEQLIAWLQQFHPKAEVAIMATDGTKVYTKTKVDLDTNGTNPIFVVGIDGSEA